MNLMHLTTIPGLQCGQGMSLTIFPSQEIKQHGEDSPLASGIKCTTSSQKSSPSLQEPGLSSA